ncbi:enoyl-CoA hydratase-related protein [Streptomyces scabiei]|uniref:enoyl-CoA hydratase-related protein n=1 Tax=Streptomyces scabiei TaxID=1930 RepID=UPI00299001B9|nr:enoyl-CoA hydratase-related protein [Streptomyces scabiei]MDW8810280.1 enoyl-CoA hydratase-related protein [Streptomyces scabiei]
MHVVVLQGAGRSFCSGYDLEFPPRTATARRGHRRQPGVGSDQGLRQDERRFNDGFFTLGRSPKPTIAKVHGHAVAGGSAIALSCDLVVMAEDARIGCPPARVWGCPTTATRVYRLGAERARRMPPTGDTIDGRSADWGLVLDAAPLREPDAAVEEPA